ncbi:MAG: PAS domain S-box protein [Planctomycetes bacterium]|nr:PAS domain S-box protein [Planctomycetota bacterium]MBM4078095.1 PAS domain S-box protein [Planctomycetota bacterium]MBM4083204.1 PAS domain S-box protein [Planctomycetota bacterium]
MTDEKPDSARNIVEQQTLLIESLPVQMWFLTDEATYGAVNQYHADFVGKAKPETEYRKLRDLFPADVAATCEQSNRAVLESKKTVVSEEWVADSHGVEHLLEITKTPVFDSNGKVKYIACFAIDITSRREAEETQHQNQKRMTTVLTALSVLNKEGFTKIDDAINQTLKLLGEFEKVDRCYVFLFAQDTASNTHEWCAPGVEPQKDNLQNLPLSDMPWWLSRIMTGQDIILSRIADLPAEAFREREVLEAQSIQSLLAVPLRMGQSPIGFLGFDAVHAPRSWDDGTILLIHVAAEGMAHAIARQKTETALAEREANYRAFLESIPDIVIVGDHEGQILYSNPTASAKLGYAPDKLKNMRVIDLHPAWVRKEAEGIVADILAGKRASCPLPVITRDGALLPVETRVSLGTWNGRECILGISKDLSVEQEALQKFAKLFGMNPALMAVSMLPDRRFVEVNSAFLRVLGYSADEVIGKTSAELGLFVNPDQQQQVAGALKEYGRIQEVEMQVKTKDGAIRDGLFSGEIIESQGKRYFLTVMIDITDRKRAEIEREKTLQELRLALAEVKTLRGIVPICAWCKKVRDDRGYWEQVESYVSKHTEAEFSHGICPECAKEQLP